MNNFILSIDTSCDETSAAVTCGRRVLSNVISSQIKIHQKYGGVYPALAKRAHQERIDFVVGEALKRAKIVIANPAGGGVKQSRDCHVVVPPPRNDSGSVSDFPLDAIAVTYGPGLAIALEVGIKKAKELASQGEALQGFCSSTLPLIAVNHMEGHIYSTLAQNRNGIPKRELAGPTLCLLVSGGHTELVLMKNHGQYKVLGATLDDACGEALDKAAKILKLGYPGGPIIERLAEEYTRKQMSLRGVANDEAIPNDLKRLLHPLSHRVRNDNHLFVLTRPLKEKDNLNFSYSGLKTQFLYLVKSLSEREFGRNLANLAASFQEAAFEQLLRKTKKAIEIYQPKTLLCGGGVIANKYLRNLLRALAKKNNLPVFFPTSPKLVGDNAAMIGVAAGYKFERKEFVLDINSLDREPRLSL